ncbi:MAG: prepilin-type N-terminal cleavage/methylation domain-containing protein [Candidatus Riflebacteria bacterium]|nr:prepilin-type N-terminal cleavage/methylation domain-containing protein [Candidatus Riflebacteria bacterium]
MVEGISIRKRRGVTLVEIVIVAAISSMVLTSAVMIMNRTTRHFKKGTDMLNIQRLMDSIVERVRTDVRSLKRIIPEKCNETSFTFFAIRDGEEKEIGYTYDAETHTLFRKDENRQSNFHGSRQVKSFLFKPELDDAGNFKFLNVAMQLISDEKGSGKASTLSIACQFYSTCVESDLKISSLRKNQSNK